MSLTQIDSDFLSIKNKLFSENETFLNKFKNNNEYAIYKKKSKRSLFWPIFITILFCLVVGASVVVLQYFFASYFVPIFIVGIVLVLISLAILLIICSNKLKQEKSISKNGYFNACLNIEKCYDKLCFYINTIDIFVASDGEKIKFYKNLSRVFNNCATSLASLYKNKSQKLSKLKEISSDWQWAIKYLYNFGKFCLNKKKDFITFASLLNY